MKLVSPRWLCTWLTALLLGSANLVLAHTLSFDPPSQAVVLGSEASIDVRLGGAMPDGLGAYDFDVTFDPALLAFDRAIDGLGLGLAIGLGTFPGVGTVTVSDFSLESVADLLALQSDDFVLFTLVFDTLAAGTSSLGFDLVTLGDAAGAPIVPAALGTGSITITAAIPEPGALSLLVLAGLAAVATRKRTVARSDGATASRYTDAAQQH